MHELTDLGKGFFSRLKIPFSTRIYYCQDVADYLGNRRQVRSSNLIVLNHVDLETVEQTKVSDASGEFYASRYEGTLGSLPFMHVYEVLVEHDKLPRIAGIRWKSSTPIPGPLVELAKKYSAK